MATEERLEIAGVQVELYRYNTVIVGSGAAALNCADRLYQFGQKQIAVVTEGMKMGTSRNTGSDKQTYYKLTMSGDAGDSVEQMARTLFEGGAVDGDLALTEAALSARLESPSRTMRLENSWDTRQTMTPGSVPRQPGRSHPNI